MSLPDWDLSPEETRRVQATLRDDERVVHVWRLNRMNTERDLENRGVQTTATVMKVHEHISGGGRRGGSVTYAPVLRFTDTAGVQQEIESSIGSCDYNFPIGQQVVIRYMPNSPSTLCIVDDSIPPAQSLPWLAGFSF